MRPSGGHRKEMGGGMGGGRMGGGIADRNFQLVEKEIQELTGSSKQKVS